MQDRAHQVAPEPHGDTDEQQAAREWADQEAERIGYIWQRRYPGGRDW